MKINEYTYFYLRCTICIFIHENLSSETIICSILLDFWQLSSFDHEIR